MNWNWCPLWISKIVCFFIGHKWMDWREENIDNPYMDKSIKQYIRFCSRCGKCEEKKRIGYAK